LLVMQNFSNLKQWIVENKNKCIAWGIPAACLAAIVIMNICWPMAGNIIALSAALIGIAPMLFIEFTRRAEIAEEKEEKRKTTLHKICPILVFMSRVVANECRTINEVREKIVSRIREQKGNNVIKTAGLGIVLTESDVFTPDMIKRMLSELGEIFTPDEFGILVELCSQYEITQTIVSRFNDELNDDLKKASLNSASDYAEQAASLCLTLETDYKNIVRIFNCLKEKCDYELTI
jgi:hypothetical protein